MAREDVFDSFVTIGLVFVMVVVGLAVVFVVSFVVVIISSAVVVVVVMDSFVVVAVSSAVVVVVSVIVAEEMDVSGSTDVSGIGGVCPQAVRNTTDIHVTQKYAPTFLIIPLSS